MKSRSRILFLVFLLACLAGLPVRSAFAASESTPLPKTEALSSLSISAGARTGWQYINGKWYYFDAGGSEKTGWLKEGSSWYYLSKGDGAMVTGWQQIGGIWYYFNPSGAMQTGWQWLGSKWYYFNPDGDMATGWKYLGGKWYYLDPSGAMQTGLVEMSNGAKYYFTENGDLKPGWVKLDNKWYYFETDGGMQKGWKQVGAYWYFLEREDGAMVTGWQQIDGKWFVFKPSGEMYTGWLNAGGGKWYYFYFNGIMAANCWLKDGGSWYYFDGDGAMMTGWQDIGGSTYYLSDGKLPGFSSTGQMVTGFQIISEKAYYFASWGALQNDWASKNVIVIDPGHSSEIPDGQVPLGPGSSEMKDADNYGTVSITNGLHEYELVLDVSLLLRDKLEARGYKVVMVRTTNTGKYSCVDRAKVANDNNAAIFLRVHANAAPRNHSKNGAMTICITKDNPYIPSMYQRSRLLSDLILNNYVSAVGCYNEGVWERDDMIANNWSKVPTTLIELGYMTNAAEDKLMQTSAYQEKMVKGMLNGIDAYFRATAR